MFEGATAKGQDVVGMTQRSLLPQQQSVLQKAGQILSCAASTANNASLAGVANLDPNKPYTVSAYYQGLELNKQVNGVPLNTNLLPPGSVQDPLTFTHNGNTSYLQLGALIDSSHYVDDPQGGLQFHQDVFGPLLPLHYIDWAVGNILGKSPTGTFTCQINVGCQ